MSKPLLSEHSLLYQSYATKETLHNLKIKVINLERSPDRWTNFKDGFDPLGIPYSRFNAIDGYKILLTDKTDNKQFTGADLKNKTAVLELKHEYKITCDPENITNPTIFDWAYLREQPFSPGLLGVYCSNFVIAKETVENSDPYVLILEDDTKIDYTRKNSEKFLEHLASYIKNIPENFDLGYVGVYRDNDHVIRINPYVNQFAPDNGWFTRMAVLLSNKGAQKFLNHPLFFYSFDNFIQDHTKEGAFEVYVATDDLRLLVKVHDDSQSDINAML